MDACFTKRNCFSSSSAASASASPDDDPAAASSITQLAVDLNVFVGAVLTAAHCTQGSVGPVLVGTLPVWALIWPTVLSGTFLYLSGEKDWAGTAATIFLTDQLKRLGL